MPVDVINQASTVTAVSGESVQFVVASTNANDAGSAAGVVVYARLANRRVANSTRTHVGNANDTSFVWGTGTALTTLKEVDWKQFELEIHQGLSRATRLANLASSFANGEYVIDHRTGLIVGKKATTGTGDTASYGYFSTALGSITVDSEFPTAAALSDNFANPTTTVVGAMGMGWDGTAWDRMPGTAADGWLVNLGANNDVTANPGTNKSSSAEEAANQIKASAGTLYGISMTNENAATRYLQLHDSASAASEGAVPWIGVPVETGKAVSIDYGLKGRGFTNGLYACASSTQNTKTLAGTDHVFDAQYA